MYKERLLMSSNAKSIMKNFIIKLIAVFMGLYLLIWIISSPVIKHFATQPLADLGLTLSDDSSISFNPFLMRLTIKDLTLLKEQTQVAKIKRLDVQLALHKLIVDKIELQTFTIDGLFIKVEQQDENLTIAGISLPKKSINNNTDNENTEDSEPAADFPFQIILPKLAITKSTLAINIDDNTHTFELNELLITNVAATTQQQSANLTLTALIDQANFNLAITAAFDQGIGEVTSALVLNEYPINKLKHFIKPLTKLDGLFTFESNQQLSISPEEIRFTLNKTQINNTDLIINDGFYSFNLKNFNNQINDFTINLENNAITALKGHAQLTLTDANLVAGNDQQQLMSFAQLSLQDITLQMTKPLAAELSATKSLTTKNAENEPLVKIAMITLDKLLTSKNHTVELPPLATINQISISNIEASASGLAINEINIDSLSSDIILNKNKLLANLVAFTAVDNNMLATEISTGNAEAIPAETKLKTTTDSNEKTLDNKSTNGFSIRLNAFNVINNNQINFIDDSVSPIYKRSIYIDKISLGALSNAHSLQENETPFELVGRSNQYAKFNFNGFIKPFAKVKTYRLKGDLTELSLPAVSTYMKDALQLELKSGQLNTDVDITLADDNIDGEVTFIIKGLETTAANNDEVNIVKDQASMPLNIALGMLMDGDGNLELGVPLSGKTSAPSFGLSSFIALVTKKAAMSAAESYVMKTFVPYANIVSLVKTAGEYLLKVRFEDLPYEIKQITPNTSQQAYLQQFIALMQDKTDTQVKLCAISVPQDIGLASDIEVDDKEQIQQLKALGEQREQAFKAYVIEHGKIDSARLLLCTPQIDSNKDAKPRLVISV